MFGIVQQTNLTLQIPRSVSIHVDTKWRPYQSYVPRNRSFRWQGKGICVQLATIMAALKSSRTFRICRFHVIFCCGSGAVNKTYSRIKFSVRYFVSRCGFFVHALQPKLWGIKHIYWGETLKKWRRAFSIGHFTVMDRSEAEGDLVLIQTFLLYYVNQVILMLTSIIQEQFP